MVHDTPYPVDMCDHAKEVPEWLQGYSGAPLVLVFGCGPSLDKMPIPFWKRAANYLSCGVNGFPILKPVQLARFMPHIWLCIDAIRDQEKRGNYPSIRQAWENKPEGVLPLRLMALANCGSTETDLYFSHLTKWENKRGYCKYGRSSVQAAVHWLINEIAPQKIALFGVDYNGPGRAGGLAGNASHQQGKRLEDTFGQLYQDAKTSGTELVNCSPGTGLKSIPTGKWKEIMNHELCNC